jgi:plastocyanin domain-containing protein
MRMFQFALMAAAIAVNGVAGAEQVTVVGLVTSIVLAKDGKSAEATLKDNKTGQDVKISVSDELTLDKFKDKRIQVGDEVRSRYDNAKQNLSKSFRKTAGC